MTICIMNNSDAKVWRINNTVGINANFTQISEAVASSSVSAGDTLYVEGSSAIYNTVELKKRLVIIGPGYFLAGTASNPGLQYHTQPATINTFYLDSLGSGSVIMGLSGYFYLSGGVDNLTLTRNNFSLYTYNLQNTGQVNSNIKITKNYLTVSVSFTMENAEITNNIISGPCSVNSTNNKNILLRNNVITYGSPNISGAYVSNNIFTVTSATFTNSTVRYNIATGNNVLPAGNNNQNNIALNTIFVASGSSDGYYRLLANSPAIGAGEPINGVTPDAGAFGTADPYRLSGIPAIPSIYELNVPASVPATASSMTVTISTRSNN
ncbi:MAG: hypothetical protein DI535_17150 [Citrobacter freundii]|nr:MAG: hypothetical protein DI535_17150 [Citrobacter freundii]